MPAAALGSGRFQPPAVPSAGAHSLTLTATVGKQHQLHRASTTTTTPSNTSTGRSGQSAAGCRTPPTGEARDELSLVVGIRGRYCYRHRTSR
jgi:hypothetical protein